MKVPGTWLFLLWTGLKKNADEYTNVWKKRKSCKKGECCGCVYLTFNLFRSESSVVEGSVVEGTVRKRVLLLWTLGLPLIQMSLLGTVSKGTFFQN